MHVRPAANTRGAAPSLTGSSQVALWQRFMARRGCAADKEATCVPQQPFTKHMQAVCSCACVQEMGAVITAS